MHNYFHQLNDFLFFKKRKLFIVSKMKFESSRVYVELGCVSISLVSVYLFECNFKFHSYICFLSSSSFSM